MDGDQTCALCGHTGYNVGSPTMYADDARCYAGYGCQKATPPVDDRAERDRLVYQYTVAHAHYNTDGFHTDARHTYQAARDALIAWDGHPHRRGVAVIRRIALAAALSLFVVTPTTTPLEHPVAVADIYFRPFPAVVAACGELQFIYSNGVAIGGDAWCAGHTSWRVVAGFAATRYGTANITLYGPWNTRWESVRYGTSKYPYARWVSYQTTG